MTPTSAQKEAIESTANLTVAIAGPGSGKTATLVARVKHVIENGVHPKRVVIITFTNEAANEVGKRLAPLSVQYCGTLHGYVLRLLMCHGDLIGFPRNLTILDEDEAEAFLNHQIKAMNLKKVPKKELRIEISKGPPKGGAVNDMTLAVGGYFQKLQQTGTIDYDTMLVFGEKIIAHMFQKNMPLGDHLFVDEVQDSGDMDFAIYRKAPFKFKTFCGDSDQSIYSFRGGRLAHLIALTRVEGAKVVKLEANFRSDVRICQAANRLIKHNKLRVDKLTCSVSRLDGEFRLLKEFDNGAVESRWVAQDIAALTDGVPAHLKEVAVLCRTNHLVDEMSLALQAAGIPVSKKTAPLLPEDWKKARLFVSLMCNPDNDYLAKKWLATGNTDAAAAEYERFALSSLQSINSAHLHFTIPQLLEVPAMMRRNGISETSVAVVVSTMNSLPDQSTVHDLSLAIANTWAMNETAGEGVTVSTIHCSPGDEQILTTRGVKQIRDLDPDSDRLVSLNGRCNQLSKGLNAATKDGIGKGFRFKKSVHHHDGELVVIETGESTTRVTPNHVVRVKFDESFYGLWTVYLMKRGAWWRIGVCGTVSIAPYKSGGISGRLATEKADAAWIIGVYNSKEEALKAEALFQAKYGITGLTFEKTHLMKDFTVPVLHGLHQRISEATSGHVERLFQDLKLLPEHPLYRRVLGSRRCSNGSAMHGYWFDTAAANIISGYMRVQVATLGEFKYNTRPRHLPVLVRREQFIGLVYGLDVPPHHYYVSGGAIVHNSAKGREWDVVYLPAFEEAVIPGTRKNVDIEEERRLAYVAVTRARHRLTISWCSKRIPKFGPRVPEPAKLSRYAGELVGAQ